MNMSISSARNSGGKSAMRAADSSSVIRPNSVPKRSAVRGCSATGCDDSALLSTRPAEPRANGLAHYEFLVSLGQPIDFEHMVDALAPGARHFRDVGTPEQAVRAKSVVHAAIVAMQAFEGIGIICIERAARQLDGDVWQFGKR